MKSLSSVWHHKNPTFGFGTGMSNFPEDYVLVAYVESNNLEEIFALTNTIEEFWWKNSKVEGIVNSRSTSVGDVVVLSNDEIWLCGMMGWRYCSNRKEEESVFLPNRL